MKFSQIIIAFALGLLVFGGIFMAENSRRADFDALKNPFESSVTLPHFIISKMGEAPTKIFSANQEMWQIYPESHVNFADNAREIVNGDVFVGFNFIEKNQITRLKQFQTLNFKSTEIIPQVGQVIVGQMMINAPGASIFVERDKENGKTKIYTYDHAIDIWFPEANTPFVMPGLHQIEINDQTVDRLGKLYYTKLRKDLRLKAFDPALLSDTPKAEALAFRSAKFEAIKEYAKKLPLSWSWFNPNSVAGDLAGTMKFLQKDYALGIPQSLRMKYEFDRLIQPFLSAHYHHENNNLSKSTQAVEAFLALQDSPEWTRFILANPRFAQQWDFLEQNQKIWLSQAFEDDSEYVFSPIWFNTVNDSAPFSRFESYFFEVEDMAANSLNKKAKNKLDSMQQSLDTIETDPSDADAVTRVRRLVRALIGAREALRSELVFQLLEDLIALEIELYNEDDPQKEEVVLENAQDVLFFLKDFINDPSATNINETLVNAYTILAVDEIESRLNRSIFSTTEKETINAVRSFRTDNLTEEQKAQVARDKALYDAIVGEIEDIDDNQVIPEVVYDEHLIDTEGEFVEMLNDAGVYTEGIDITILNPDGPMSFQFRGAYYSDYSLSGNFKVQNESFTQINMKGIIEKEVNPRFLRAILRSMSDELEEQKIIEPIDLGPANDTPLAIIQRKLVQEIFEQEGLEVNRNYVKIISNDYNESEVSEALLGKEYRLKFVYHKKEEYVTNLVVEYVRNRFDFGEQVIPRKGITDFVTKEVEARFQSGDTNPGR